MSLNAGENLGRYTIDSQLGAGGMGEVYLAHDPSLARKIAIKILEAEFANDAERLERFVREARSASALNHPNILTIFEITREGDLNYIVSEYVEGETLKAYLRRRRPSVGEALDIAIQTASALAAAHDAGIVHRDIKPANIMIRKDGIVKVVDFGIAKLVQPMFDAGVHGEAPTVKQGGTKPGMMLGTPRYMSPEQARGKPVDRRSDIFSLGLVFFELFTGERAFDGESAVDVLSSILKDEAPPVSSVNPSLPRQLERIVAKTLRKDLEHRYQDVRDLLIDLEDIRDELRFKEKTGGGKTIKEAIHFTDADTAAVTGSLTQGIVQTRRFTVLHVLIGAVVVFALGASYLVWDSYSHEERIFPDDFKTEEVASWSSAPGELFSKARFSPDGKLIAFSSTRSGSKDIWVTQANSTEAIQITKDDFANTDPVWSPDGSEIAYFSNKAAGGTETEFGGSLWKVSALGGTARSIGPIADGSSELKRWTADGKIIYQSQGELFAMDANSGDATKLTNLKTPDRTVTWVDLSDKQDKVAYVTEQPDDKWVLREKDIDGSSERVLMESASRISSVVWISASDTYFVSAEVDGIDQILGLVDGRTEPIRVTNNPTSSVVVDASPDGSTILFTSVKEESDIWEIKLDDLEESPVSRSISSELWPAVGPAGKRFAFESVRNMDRGNLLLSATIRVKDLEGEKPEAEGIVVTENGGLPVWSPDGSRLAFVRLEPKGHSLWVVSATGGEETRLAGPLQPVAYSISPYNRVQATEYSWNKEGTQIAFSGRGDSGAAINVVTIDEPGSVKPVSTPDPGHAHYCPIFSPDGERIAFFSQKTGGGKTIRQIAYTELASGETKKLIETDRLMRLIGWDREGQSLIVAEAVKFSSLPPETILWKLSETGELTRIASLQNAYYYNIFLSPDQTQIAYAARNGDRDNVWVMPAAGGNARSVTDNKDSETYISALAWAPNNSAILFGKQTRFSLLSKLAELKK